jgi:cysteine desulfurase/selenocysteine lyase
MKNQAVIYFDNAATSWPKPPDVKQAMNHFLDHVGASPGRSGHQLANEAGRIVYETREAIAELFNAPDPMQVTFCHNVTEALNLVLYGILRPDDHVITSSMEHNSMMRPLRDLEFRGVKLTVIPCSPQGILDPGDIKKAILPETKIIALNHASNVIGTILPIKAVGQIAREHDLLFLVDSAQSAGAVPIDFQSDLIDLLAFTGHKSLLGPTGTGGLIVEDRLNLRDFRPLKLGGTGSRSEFEFQPDFLPDIFESGTLNSVGLAGLGASVRWILAKGVDQIRQHEIELTQMLIDGLQKIPGIQVYGTRNASRQTATISFNLHGWTPSELALRLDEAFKIMCRVGLHCAPAAHKTMGTFPDGTVRFGMGYFNTTKEVETALQALEKLSGT